MYVRSEAEQADYDERHSGPVVRNLRAAFYSVTGEVPTLGPGDTDGAQAFLSKINEAIGIGGWTPRENKKLRTLHEKWVRRASGTDLHFQLHGNAQGRLRQISEQTIVSTGVSIVASRIRQIATTGVTGGEVSIAAKAKARAAGESNKGDDDFSLELDDDTLSDLDLDAVEMD